MKNTSYVGAIGLAIAWACMLGCGGGNKGFLTKYPAGAGIVSLMTAGAPKVGCTYNPQEHSDMFDCKEDRIVLIDDDTNHKKFAMCAKISDAECSALVDKIVAAGKEH